MAHWGKYLLVFTVGITGSYFFFKPSVPNDPSLDQGYPKIVQGKVAQVRKKSKNEQYIRIYRRLGLETGDILQEVNGIHAGAGGQMFRELLSGFASGKVCVKFERNKQKRQSCFEKSESGERVDNIPLNDTLNSALSDG